MRYYLLSFTLLISFLSCSERKEHSAVYVIKNSRGDTSFVGTIDKDSILNGPAISYYKNGKIRAKLNFLNDAKNGDVFIYDSITNRLIVKQIFCRDTLKYYECYNSSGKVIKNWRYLTRKEIPLFDSAFVSIKSGKKILIIGDTIDLDISIPGIPDAQVFASLNCGSVIRRSTDTSYYYKICPLKKGVCKLNIMLKTNENSTIYYGSIDYKIIAKK